MTFNYLLKYSASHDKLRSSPSDDKLHLTQLWKVSGVNLQSWKGEDKNLRGNSHPFLNRRNWSRAAVLLHLHFRDNSASLWNIHTSLPSISEKNSLLQLSLPTLSVKIKKPNRLPAVPFHTLCQYPYPLVTASSSFKSFLHFGPNLAWIHAFSGMRDSSTHILSSYDLG